MNQAIITATPAFVRTRCRACTCLLAAGDVLVSKPDGFRHLACAGRSEGK